MNSGNPRAWLVQSDPFLAPEVVSTRFVLCRFGALSGLSARTALTSTTCFWALFVRALFCSQRFGISLTPWPACSVSGNIPFVRRGRVFEPDCASADLTSSPKGSLRKRDGGDHHIPNGEK
uniref:Uncharacterized protein n=1 Tax=Opuntia streptacantha TaxID=393608 RepID=A0A7C9CWW0_OPUST